MLQRILAARARVLPLLAFLRNRLAERSTWAALVPAAAALGGMQVRPDLAETIATLGVMAAGALPALVPDGRIAKAKKPAGE